MRILAIDTTGLAASVAIVDEEKTVAEFTTNYKKTHSQTIMPMIEKMVEITGIELSELDYIACACGPGSFTGLRIGAATAKGLAHALDKRIIPIPTLDALACNMYGADGLIVPIMDARRNQVYTAIYSCTGGSPKLASEYMACDIDELLERVLEIDDNAVFLGDGVPVFKAKLSEHDTFSLAPVCANMQRAACVGKLALERTDRAVDCNDFEILYLRKSQAEREREEQNAAKNT